MARLILLIAFIICQAWLMQSLEAQTQHNETAVTWMPTRTIPMIVTARISGKDNILSLEIPNEVVETSIESQQETTGADVIATPELTIDQTIVEKRRFVLVTKQFRLDQIEFFDVDGESIATNTAMKLLVEPRVAIYGTKPSKYLRSILRDDLVCIMPKNPNLLSDVQSAVQRLEFQSASAANTDDH